MKVKRKIIQIDEEKCDGVRTVRSGLRRRLS